MKKLTLLITIILVVTTASAQIINIPADYPTIQQGIDAANNGDTILVDAGTYVENININEKDITVASHYLTTLDTSFITQTIIDGNLEGAVVRINDSSDFVLAGFTITNGLTGIFCSQLSNPLLKDLIVTNNKNYQSGGIYIGFSSTARLENILVEDNLAYDSNYLNPGAGDAVGYGKGGGISCGENSTPVMKNVVIRNNIADGFFGGYGGGLYLLLPCGPVLENVTITGNYAAGDGLGGGICGRYVLYDKSSSNHIVPQSYDHKINTASKNASFTPVFDGINRCNIFFNKAAQGNDFRFDYYDTLNILLDTSTVLNPTEFHALSGSNTNLIFDVSNAKLTQVEANLYVSPEGDNNNSGLSIDQPLKTIYRANSMLVVDSSNPHTIYLDEGTYSPLTTGEFYPINLPEYVNLVGESETKTILNAEDSAGVIYLFENQFNHISNLTITGGNSAYGAGILSVHSDPLLENLSIFDNYCHHRVNGYPGLGGGIYLFYSNPTLVNVSIHDNLSGFGGGMCFYKSNPIFDTINRCDIYSNQAIGGNDLGVYFLDLRIPIIVDTFTVQYPKKFHAIDLPNFSFDILNGMFEQRSADLFISPQGDDSNTGLSAEDPLKTIHFAQSVILTDTLNHYTLYLQNGLYSPSQTGEFFPVNLLDYLNISGTSPNEVILDSEHTSAWNIILNGNNSNYISGLTITRGGVGDWFNSNAGMSCVQSNPVLENLIITDNNSTGIYFSHSDAQLTNVLVNNNELRGIYVGESSNPYLENVTVANNNRDGIFLSSHSSPILNNVLVAENGENGIYFSGYSSPIIQNTTIANNIGNGMDIKQWSNHPVLSNTIIWGNTNEVVINCNSNYSSSITVSYSNIRGGESGIVNDTSCTVNWLEGNINKDPVFLGMWEHPYQINNSSPCIDAGTPDTTGLNLPEYDLAGEVRIFNNRVDIGSYEWNTFVGIEETSMPRQDNIQVDYYPNPFTTSTTIEYNLTTAQTVTINFYNQFGKQVDRLEQKQTAGVQQVVWIPALPGGIYYFRLQAGKQVASGKMVVVR